MYKSTLKTLVIQSIALHNQQMRNSNWTLLKSSDEWKDRWTVNCLFFRHWSQKVQEITKLRFVKTRKRRLKACQNKINKACQKENTRLIQQDKKHVFIKTKMAVVKKQTVSLMYK